jgi:hypothetical protein
MAIVHTDYAVALSFFTYQRNITLTMAAKKHHTEVNVSEKKSQAKMASTKTAAPDHRKILWLEISNGPKTATRYAVFTMCFRGELNV